MDTSHKQEQIYGRKTWNLLHSMSAYYPEQPTAEDKANVKTFLESFMEVGIDHEKWGKKFLNRMSKEGENPLNLSSREDFSVWMCNQHNLFNKDLGKSQFNCIYENLQSRWGPVVPKAQQL